MNEFLYEGWIIIAEFHYHAKLKTAVKGNLYTQ